LPFDELLEEFELELLDELELELLDEFELELLDEFELELLEELKLELLDEFELQLLDEFELELLDELELELLDEFELELPADAGCVETAASTALITASGGELPTEPSFMAAVATRPQAPSPAAYVFQYLGTFSFIVSLAFLGVAGCADALVPGGPKSTVNAP
jgi:hypothetical protein